MAKINKLQKSGVTIYPATIPQAVIDSETGKTQKEVNDEFKAIQDGQLKIKNEIVNGDFKNGSIGISLSSFSIDSFTTGEVIAKVTAIAASARAERSIEIETAGDKYYFNTLLLPKYATGTSVQIGGVRLPFTVIGGVWNVLSGIVTPDTTGPLRVYHATSTLYLIGDIVKFGSSIVINLTKTFGAGNEPTKAEMDELIKILPNGYFEGDLQNKYLHIWQLKLIRQNRNAIVALGGTII